MDLSDLGDLSLADETAWLDRTADLSHSWRRTIGVQQRALKRLLRGGSLRRHAEQARSEAYLDGASLAAAETGPRPERFPTECPWTLDELPEYSL